MPLYEHTFLTRPDVSAQQVEALVEQYKGIIETGGGTVAKIEHWGVKSLAYKINKSRKAYFTHLSLDTPPAALAEVERQLRINEDVMRFLTIKVDAFEEGASVMMQKRDRDEKKSRRRDGEEGEFGSEEV
jgi:small subunit ribosomal protein S6